MVWAHLDDEEANGYCAVMYWELSRVLRTVHQESIRMSHWRYLALSVVYVETLPLGRELTHTPSGRIGNMMKMYEINTSDALTEQ